MQLNDTPRSLHACFSKVSEEAQLLNSFRYFRPAPFSETPVENLGYRLHLALCATYAHQRWFCRNLGVMPEGNTGDNARNVTLGPSTSLVRPEKLFAQYDWPFASPFLCPLTPPRGSFGTCLSWLYELIKCKKDQGTYRQISINKYRCCGKRMLCRSTLPHYQRQLNSTTKNNLNDMHTKG